MVNWTLLKKFKNANLYRKFYRQWSSLASAITRKGHYYLFTTDNQQRNLLTIYSDKDLSKEVAVFKKDPQGFFMIRETIPRKLFKQRIGYRG